MTSRHCVVGAAAILVAAAVGPARAADGSIGPNDATTFTSERNRAFGASLDLSSAQDFEDASRGLVGRLPDDVIKSPKGDTVWDGRRFAFIQGEAPRTVNPSLWRQEKLNSIAGLFKVVDGIWQVRGYDLANMTLVSGKTGWIVIDPLFTAEAARATLEFAMERLGRRPVVAVIYTHSHVDHYGGVRGVVDEADVRAGKVKILAPDGFLDNAVAENILAGNAMSRRGQYMFGAALRFEPRGAVGSGLGKALSRGTIGLLAPTDIVRRTGEERTVDGVRMVFQMASGSEAPAEFAFYFPEQKALCMSEVVTAHMHNLYTLRGAKTRDALGWSKYINEMIDLFPEATVAFRSHHWPLWSKERIRRHLVNQRDMYRYLHDAALHAANTGVKLSDLADLRYYPKALRDDLSTHGYYGTLSHNLRAVYAFYLGFYDGNPATLDPIPRDEAARRYVAAMGGAEAVLARARAAYDAGDYRWAAELNDHVVMADPRNASALALQADILEQLGYQAESGVWRNEYLVAARELRGGVERIATTMQGLDVVRAMTPELIFDYLAVRLNHQKVDGRAVGVQIDLTDAHETYALELSNAVLNNTRGRALASPNAKLTLTRAALLKMLVTRVPLPELVKAGEAKLEGDPSALATIFTNVDTFTPSFDIVTPLGAPRATAERAPAAGGK